MLQLGVGALAHAGSAGGDACMPLDVVNLLKSDVATEVASRCQDVIDEDGRCTADCAEVARRFQSEHCYPHLTQSQRLQPRQQRPNRPWRTQPSATRSWATPSWPRANWQTFANACRTWSRRRRHETPE